MIYVIINEKLPERKHIYYNTIVQIYEVNIY